MRAVRQLAATVDAAGVVRWDSNGRVPFDDVLAAVEGTGAITSAERAASNAARSREAAAAIAEYRANQPAQPDEEQRAEARAAFGPGVEVVDVLTGRRYTT